MELPLQIAFWLAFLSWAASALFLVGAVLIHYPKGGATGSQSGEDSVLREDLDIDSRPGRLKLWTRSAAAIFFVLSLALFLLGSRLFDTSIL